MINFKEANKFIRFWFWAGIIPIMVGCGGPFGHKDGLSDLNSPDPTIRIMAVKRAGDNKISEAVPYLVDSLQHEDHSVRFYSIEALQRITGKDYGYDYKAAPHLRAAAVKRWKKSLDPNGL